jgi:MGT family glycosyltransferase
MARFLTTVWPVPGHLHPNLAVGKELTARGHEVAFYTGPKARALVEGEGLRHFPFQRVNERRFDELLEAIGAIALDWKQTPRQLGYWREWLFGMLPDELADIETILDDWRPDAIICDPAMWAPILVLRETRQVPVAVFSYLLACVLPGPDAPLNGIPLPRPRNSLDRLARQVLQTTLDLVAQPARRDVDALRRRYGLPPVHSAITAYTARMPLYLQQSVRELDYNRQDLPPNVHYVGLCPWDRKSDEPPPAFLSELRRDQPAIYVTDGTMHFQRPLVLGAALAGLANAPIQIIATSNRSPADLGFPALPANVRLERWVPHGDLFPLVDLIVTTGGTQTVLKALKAGVPLILVPSAWDQPENAWRVVDAGVGVRLSPSECTPERLRAAVTHVLTTPAYRQNAQRFSEIIKGYDGPARAATLLETLVPSRASPTGTLA